MLDERLRAVPFFRGLPGEDLQVLISSMRSEEYRAGDLVFREGDVADALYMVESGLVEVRRGGEPLAVLGAGSFVGELGLLLGEARSADLVVIADAVLWMLTRAAVDTLLERHPTIGLELSRELGRRLVVTSRQAVVVPPPRVAAFWGDVSSAEHLIRLLVGETGADPMLLRADQPIPSAGDRLVVAMLPTERTRLSRAVLRAADFVVCTSEPPAWVLRRHDSTRVLRLDGSVPFDRVVRRVARRSIGLVLSSGGSKTVAHLGVADELDREGVPIDAIAGSSGGAIIAAALAAGIPHLQRLAYLREVATLLGVRRWDFNIPPRTGLMKGRRFRDAVDRILEGRTFGDLPVPLYLVATDLGTGDEVVIDSGNLADAVRASLGIPGAFDPWLHDGRLLIDGAIVNPLPASVLRDRGIDTVIASMVAGKREDPNAPRLTKPPPVLQTLLRMVNLMERELIKGQLPLVDVLIRPEVATNYSFDFTSTDEFVAEGRRAACATIAAADPALMSRRAAVGLA